jgi:hypothetical protein
MQLKLLQGRSLSLASAKKGAWLTPAQKKYCRERRFHLLTNSSMSHFRATACMKRTDPVVATACDSRSVCYALNLLGVAFRSIEKREKGTARVGGNAGWVKRRPGERPDNNNAAAATRMNKKPKWRRNRHAVERN